MIGAFQILFLLAALQGLSLSAVLFTRKRNRAANTILAFAMLCLSLDLLSAYYYSTGLFRSYPQFMGVTYPFPLLYGPLFYLYARLVSRKAARLRILDWLHFVPVAAVYALNFPIFFYSADEKVEFVAQIMQGFHPPLFVAFDYILPLQGILYTWFTIRIVRDYDKRIRNAFSNVDMINLNWLKQLTYMGLLIWIVVAILLFVRPYAPEYEAAIQVALSVFIYSIGYKGLKQPEIFLDSSVMGVMSRVTEKYRRSGLKDMLAGQIRDRLIALMANEKPYLDDSLTLQRLADRLDVSPHNLSEVINSTLQLSYYDFINAYRIEEFKKRIADPENDPFNILSVALDSGFPSKGSFNAIFKKHTGMTPSEYKGKVRGTLAPSPLPETPR